MLLNTEPVCKQPGHNPDRLVGGGMVLLGDHETETEKPLQAQAMRLQLHKSPFTQELCHGGTWETNTDQVCTGGAEVVSQCWDHNAASAGAAPRGDTQTPRYLSNLIQPDLFQVGSFTEDFQRSLPTWIILCSDCMTGWDVVWIISPSYGSEVWLQAGGGKVWSSPLWSGHCWEQHWTDVPCWASTD